MAYLSGINMYLSGKNTSPSKEYSKTVARMKNQMSDFDQR
jgi:hypothetical protein